MIITIAQSGRQKLQQDTKLGMLYLNVDLQKNWQLQMLRTLLLKRILILFLLLATRLVVANENQVFTGKLISVNLAKSEIVIENDKQQQSIIAVARSTRIIHGDQKVTLITLCPEQQIAVSIDSSIPAVDKIRILGDRKLPPKLLYPTSELVTVIRGDLPIIISAPHGGREAIPGVPKRNNESTPKFAIKSDTNTYQLASTITEQLEKKLNGKPWLIAAKFHRSYLDANRSLENALEHDKAKAVYTAYHQALQHAILEITCQYKTGLLIDVHGQSRLPDVVWRGTRRGTTLGGLVDDFGWDVVEGKDSLMHTFNLLDYATHPQGMDASEGPFGGGFITATYGYPYGLNAIQLEFGYSFRANKEIYLKTAIDTAEAIKRFHQRYLTKKLDCEPDAINR